MSSVEAGPADYVFVPGVEYGERELDFKFGNAANDNAVDANAATLGLGWGARPRWFVELYGVWEKAAGESWELEEFEFENKFQLTETGRYAVDVGAIVELEYPCDSANATELKIGPLFQKDLGRIQLNWNPLFEREFGGERASGEEHEIELDYQWQVKYRWRPVIELGAQGFGAVGEWSDWEPSAAQSHMLGPAAFGRRSRSFRLIRMDEPPDTAP